MESRRTWGVRIFSCALLVLISESGHWRPDSVGAVGVLEAFRSCALYHWGTESGIKGASTTSESMRLGECLLTFESIRLSLVGW